MILPGDDSLHSFLPFVRSFLRSSFSSDEIHCNLAIDHILPAMHAARADQSAAPSWQISLSFIVVVI